ncbi:MAG TPA: polysaccharide deacetylase family protein, partial [Candidatus Polarisedimenticolaceae bacterium]|nr:polysaccharide deacetylase family protein [Candidatus Polarisedimenticolaceae bacterium]
PAAPTEDGRFAVLAFDRIVPLKDPKYVDRAMLRDQLRALHAAGYQAISLRELRAALFQGAALPRKPVLLTFDEGYLSTYEAADPVLRELRWPAVMFLRTERQERRDVAYLFWDRVERMRESGLWEIASGDPCEAAAAPADELPASPPGVALIRRRLGAEPIAAWAPRGVDPVVALGVVEPVRRRREAGASAPWLGFVDDLGGANGPDANPYRLARLRVPASWSASDLVGRVDRALAPAPAAGPSGPETATWLEGEGSIAQDGAALRLAGAPRAAIWIPAAKWADDWVLEASIACESGEFWIVQPDDAPTQEWRFGGTERSLYVQRRAGGRPPDLLASFDRVPGRRWHSLRLARRGGGLSISWDGARLGAGPVAIGARWRGPVGIVAYGRPDGATLRVAKLRFGALAYDVRPIPAEPSAEDVRRLVREADTIAAISPPWAVVERGRLREAAWDGDLLGILSRRYAWDLLPAVRVGPGPAADDGAWVSVLIDRARERGFAGYRLDLGDRAATQSKSIHALEASLRRSGRRLVVRSD